MPISFGTINAVVLLCTTIITVLLSRRDSGRMNLSFIALTYAVVGVSGVIGSHFVYNTPIAPTAHSMLFGIWGLSVLALTALSLQWSNYLIFFEGLSSISLIALGVGKLSCFQVGCCSGVASFFGINVAVQLVELLLLTSLGLVQLGLYFTRCRPYLPGSMLAIYGAVRSFAEIHRSEYSPVAIAPIKLTQLFSLSLCLFGVLYAYITYIRRRSIQAQNEVHGTSVEVQ